MTRVAHRICPLCEACCGLELMLDGDRVIEIRGHEADVSSGGFICPKGAALAELHEDPDRLRSPMVKRDGAFVEVTWDEAFAEIERRLPPILAEHGPNSVAMVIGNPAAHKAGLLLYGARLSRAIGTSNIYSASTLDQMPKQLAAGWMFGHWLSVPVPDIVRTELLVILGANPMASNGSMWTVPDFKGKAKALQARGGKIIVIDPRVTETARLADQHLSIRPGGDAFFLLGIVHTLFAEDLVKLGRLAEHMNGVDELRAAITDFPPERVAARCGIEAETIRSLARQLATTGRAALYGRIGTCTQEYGTLASWLVDAINALTGHLDEPGGAMFAKAAAFAANTAGASGRGKGITTGRRRSRVSGAPEVFGELPMTCLAEEIETPGDGQIKAAIIIAGNPVLSAPNGPRIAAAFDQLELVISFDIYLGETSQYADVILPAYSSLAESHYDVALSQLAWRNTARYSTAVVPAPMGHPAEWEMLVRLIGIVKGRGGDVDVTALDDELAADDLARTVGSAAQLVLSKVAPLRGPERLLELALRAGPYGDRFGMASVPPADGGVTLAKLAANPAGIDLGELAPRVPEILRTPSGKVELAPPPLIEDLARARADLDRAVPPLVIIGRRHLRSNNSWMHNLPTLAAGKFRGAAMVHPTDAARLGLTDGGRGRITRGERSIEVAIEVTSDIMPGVVSLPHGWGHGQPGTKLRVAAERPGANLNAILDDTLRDPLSGNAVLGGVAIDLAPL
ncbi:MAG: molybdopterin-dependent oxidoreductase [Deltaproteobacteria bacterium]|nr:molybdopterin-dependent oxidoreductase [Deltaproteobacteria bacterium]